MVVLVLQSFGNENEYTRAIFAIWSFYANTAKPVNATETILYTDKPNYFTAYLNELPVKFVELSPDRIKEMRGEIDFIHRMKIALIEETFQTTNASLLYVDSDTFFISDLYALTDEINPENSFMHKKEYEFISLEKMRLPAAIPFHAFLNLILKQSFTITNGITIKVPERQSSWNAGAMMLHQSHAKLIPDVYSLTDQFYRATQNHASEQYAFSILLQDHTKVRPLEKYIYHYWYRVEKKIADQFLAKINASWAKLTKEQKLIDAKKWTKVLPAHFAQHKLMLRDRSIQAFNENQFKIGYLYAVKALTKSPFDLKFIRDILYHTRRSIFGS